MKTGFTFTNQDMELIYLCFEKTERNNLALLLDHENGLFSTTRDVLRKNSGS